MPTNPAPATEKPRTLVTVREAAEQLGIDRDELYELLRTGKLASVKMPPGSQQSGRRILQADLDLFIGNATAAHSSEALLVSVDDACAQLSVERSKLYQLMRDGDLASVKIPPGMRRIEQAEIDAFIRRNTVTS